MAWNLDFISEEDFKKHVRATIMKYGEKLESYDLKRFNSNLIDPIKLIFDKSVYRTSWEEIVNNEIFRQRDKSNNNDIGYFHQNIFLFQRMRSPAGRLGCYLQKSRWNTNARWRYCTYNVCRNEEQTQYYEFCILRKNIYKNARTDSGRR